MDVKCPLSPDELPVTSVHTSWTRSFPHDSCDRINPELGVTMATHLPAYKESVRLRSDISPLSDSSGAFFCCCCGFFCGTASSNASELLREQPDHLCLHLQTQPGGWQMRGTGHPLRRYAHLLFFVITVSADAKHKHVFFFTERHKVIRNVLDV